MPCRMHATPADAKRTACTAPCLQLYEDSPDLRLNDVVEVVGVLSRVPDLAAAHMAPPNEVCTLCMLNSPEQSP